MGQQDAVRAATALLERFGLGDRQADRVATYSKGMKQKPLIAHALIANPRIVFLDEQTADLDPEAAHQLINLHPRPVRPRQGHTFSITSHGSRRWRRCGRKWACSPPDGSPLSGPPRRWHGRSSPRCGSASLSRLVPPLTRRIAGLHGVIAIAPVDVGRSSSSPVGGIIPAVVRQIAAMPGDLLDVGRNRPPWRRHTCDSCTARAP